MQKIDLRALLPVVIISNSTPNLSSPVGISHMLQSKPMDVVFGDIDRIKFLIYTRLTEPGQTPTTSRQIYEFLEQELHLKSGEIFRHRILRRSIRNWIDGVTDFVTSRSSALRRPRVSFRQTSSPLVKEYRQLRKLCFVNKIKLDRIYLSELALRDKVAVLQQILHDENVDSKSIIEADLTSCSSTEPSSITNDVEIESSRASLKPTRKRKFVANHELQEGMPKGKRHSISSCISDKSFDDFDMFRPIVP